MMKKRENIVIIIVLILMVLALVGVSYAAFNYTKEGSGVNKITTGDLSMEYAETDNVINLTGALPTTDETGMVRLTEGEYFDFTITSSISNNTNINYEISAKEEGTGTIDGSNIKLYLTEIVDGGERSIMSPKVYSEETSSNEYTGRPSNEMSLYQSSMNSSEEHHYRLRMYVTEEYNPQGDGGGLTFAVRVNVYGKAGDLPPSAGETVISNLTSGSTYDDGVDTFITGEDPNNYVWYSGKLWRAVSVNNEENTTKLVTQWNISTITYSNGSSAFEGSYMEDWLNDTSVDGFLGNLRDPEDFIVMDAEWNATQATLSSKPAERTMVEDAVGLLNYYEYVTSYRGTTYRNGYLNNGLDWWTLTPSSASEVWSVNDNGNADNDYSPSRAFGIRPSINLKSSVRIVDGDGTIDNPYRLNGDNDTELSGALLSSRYSGEYVKFGNSENNLYRIVSHETEGLTKIVSAEPLKSSGAFITSAFDSNSSINYSTSTTIGALLNGEYLTNYVDSTYSDMIEDSTIWYFGTVGSDTSYKLAKYTDTNMSSVTLSTTDAKAGLLRFGELMSGQFERYAIKGGASYTGLTTYYWTLTPYNTSTVRFVDSSSPAGNTGPSIAAGIRPSLNLKSNVIITGGDGTKNNPFALALQ